MNDCLLKDVARQFGTPSYMYDGDCIEKQYNTLRSFLPENFQIFYSAKANPLLGICQIMKNMGSGIEVASVGELYLAQKAGFTPEQIIFTSPGKTAQELIYAVESNIYCINIECTEEAVLLNQIAEERSKIVNIAVRVNPDFNLQGSRIKMSGVSSQFGIDQGEVKNAFETLKTLANIKLIGIHVYCGTQVLSSQSLLECFEEEIKLALALSDEFDFSLEFLDLGGGFGIPYFKNEYPLDIVLLKDGMSKLIRNYGTRLEKTRVAVESGRFLLAECGLYLTKVLYVKKCKGSKFIVCDGGSNHHASSAFLGRHVRNNFPMRVLEKSENCEEVTVVGPLCTPTDVIGQKVLLPTIETEDIIAIEKSGAYGLTHSPVMFLSHEMPIELVSYKGEINVARERGRKEDFLKNQLSLF
ncbi:type III PLP-dependent enzyme [Acetivibrio cellulolyticus]|uniref:type III PLP-dependent enzyme n=1 Tax=Acetivibrio cellulolyticus TaxID=35830 RepID=UPI0001E2E2D6|nr:type III PLP-dependent enzyme [Acetivibrio cellulolyticus]